MTTIVAIGHKRIRFLVVDSSGGRVSLISAFALAFESDIFAAADVQSVAAKVSAFIRQNRIPAGDAVFTLVHQDLVIKELSLPGASLNDVGKIVAHQIESLPRFTAGQYCLAHQDIQDVSSGKINVTYCVLVRALLNKAISILAASGFRPVAFDLIPCSVVSLAPASAYQSGVVPNILVEDGLTYILLRKQDEVVGIYTVDTGADDLYNAPAAVKAWASNVERTLRSHETLKGVNLGSFQLFWDNNRIPGLDHALAGASGRDSAVPRLEDAIFNKASFAGMNYSYWPLLGMFARRARGTGHLFNVENMWDLHTTAAYRNTVSFLIAGVVVLAFAFTAVFFLNINKERTDLAAQKIRIEKKISDLDATTKTMKMEREKATLLRKNFLKQANMVAAIKQFSWANVFIFVNEAMPEDVWLRSFTVDRSGRVSLTGTGLTMDAVAKLLRGLERNDKLAQVEMKSTSQRTLEKVDVVDFNITAMLVSSRQEKK